MFLPSEGHGRAVDREVDVGDPRAIFHASSFATVGTRHQANLTFDHQLDVGAASFKVQDLKVFQAHEGSENVVRV
jgi:hypothetical protein